MTEQPAVVTSHHDAFQLTLLSKWLHIADVGMCAVDDAGRVIMLTPAACSLLAVDGLAVLDTPVHGMLIEAGCSALAAAQMADEKWFGEVQVAVKREGAMQHLLLKSSLVPTSASAKYKVIAITDITRLVLAQRRIDSEPSRRHWQALNAGVVISDAQAPDLPIVFVNKVFEEMSGYAAEEIMGRNCRFLQGSDTQQAGLGAIREAIQKQTNGFALLRNYRKDGSIFLNQLFISPVRDAAGVVTHFVGIQHLHTAATAPDKAVE
jgi:PAS domain S-box-containing protein